MMELLFPSDIYLKYSVPMMIVWGSDGRCYEVTYDEYDRLMEQPGE